MKNKELGWWWMAETGKLQIGQYHKKEQICACSARQNSLAVGFFLALDSHRGIWNLNNTKKEQSAICVTTAKPSQARHKSKTV
eukprot:scaffold21053_cov42-Attheya_sp.AAC.2